MPYKLFIRIVSKIQQNHNILSLDNIREICYSITIQHLANSRFLELLKGAELQRRTETEENMNTLYVSDLDGTLLRSDEKISEYTCSVINSLTEKGLIFSYATARSFMTAKKVTKGLVAKIPVIIYNGAFVIDNVTEKMLIENYFDKTVYHLLDDLFRHNIYPTVYAFIDGREKFSFVPELCTPQMSDFLSSRRDIRSNPVKTTDELTAGKIFYISCIGNPEKLEPFYEKYKTDFHCIYARDFYSKAQWLEIMPKNTSKANAVKELKKLLHCERVVAFGDGKNDLDMFQLADESYAVKNAHEDLKKYATDIILSNDEDGVAKWLELNIK